MIYIFLAIAAIYLIFFLRLRSSFKSYKIDYKSNKEINCSYVSVVVAVKDEETNIKLLLNSLAQQNYPIDKIEFIIVDDNSKDRTYEFVMDRVTNDNRFHILKAGNSSSGMAPKKWALNRGIDKAKGQIILMTDGDCTMNKHWAVDMTQPFNDQNVGMVLGSSPLGNSFSFWDRVIRMDSIGLDAIMMSTAISGSTFTASGRNLAIRKKTFYDIGGYNAIRQFTSGDDDLLMHLISKSRWKIVPCLTKGSEVESPAPASLGEFVRQRLRFASKGKAYYQLGFVSPLFRLGLVLIFVTNLVALYGQWYFFIQQELQWLFPWFIKIASDGLLITAYLSQIGKKFDLPYFLFNEIWHSLYVTLFGILGPFLPIHWKGRLSKTDFSIPTS